jgi:acetyl esterase/lipase
MTFIASFMRNVADHTSLADIVLIRRLISLHFIIPLPADAIITPITFVVPLRTGERVARGFLRDLDSKETGKRELSGEWVVGTAVWQRLKREKRARQEEERKKRRLRRLAELNASHPSPGERERTPDVTDVEGDIGRKEGYAGERVIYYIHGGAYYVGNAATHRLITIGVSKACNARVFGEWLVFSRLGCLVDGVAITYRLAPEHAFPLPLHDVLHGYLRLLAPPLRIPPENIVIMGDSAGGGLGLALCMYLRDEGYRMPAGLVLMSPWVDLTMSCGSWDENAETDVVPRPETDGEEAGMNASSKSTPETNRLVC